MNEHKCESHLTPVGYLNNYVVFECDLCWRKMVSRILRKDFLSRNELDQERMLTKAINGAGR